MLSSALRHMMPPQDESQELTEADRVRLGLFVWDYKLEHDYGIKAPQARGQLMFLRWLRDRGRVTP